MDLIELIARKINEANIILIHIRSLEMVSLDKEHGIIVKSYNSEDKRILGFKRQEDTILVIAFIETMKVLELEKETHRCLIPEVLTTGAVEVLRIISMVVDFK